MKSAINLAVCFILAISLLFISSVWGIGLAVDPGEIKIYNVPLGKKVAVSELGGERMKLKITNKGGAAYTYIINVLTTTEAKAEFRQGYADIPDTLWIWPEKKEVRVAGNSTKDVELYLKIPKVKEYYNKRYQAIIEVKSKKNRSEEIFVLACQLRIRFSTSAGEEKKKEDINLNILQNNMLQELPQPESLEEEGCAECKSGKN